MLPDEMPAHFQSTYTPIAAAGTPGQIKHISRLLAVQLTNVGLGIGMYCTTRLNVSWIWEVFVTKISNVQHKLLC